MDNHWAGQWVDQPGGGTGGGGSSGPPTTWTISPTSGGWQEDVVMTIRGPNAGEVEWVGGFNSTWNSGNRPWLGQTEYEITVWAPTHAGEHTIEVQVWWTGLTEAITIGTFETVFPSPPEIDW